MSIRKRDVHFSDWTKVRHALVCNNVQGITETSSFDDVRAFLINSESGSNPFYYYVCYIKETKEIYTHGQFYAYSKSSYDDTELRNLIGTKADLSALEALVSEVSENELVTAKALYDLNDRKLDKSELDNIDLSNYVDLETYNSDLDSINASITNKANQSDLESLSAEVEENEEVTAAALTELHENKADKSELPDVSTFATNTDLNTKQDLLVSGTNIKTVNGDSILGSGNIEIHDTKVTSAANHYGYDSNNATSTTGAFVTKITKDAANHVTSFESRALTSTDIPGLDASKITSGTIDIARLPKGALEQLHHYETKELAQQAVIDKSVQLGDTVQINHATMYICTNDSATTFAIQFTEYVAGTAASVPWSGITGKPTGIDEWGNRIGVIESDYATQSWVGENYLSKSGGTINSNEYVPLTVKNKNVSEVWLGFEDSIGTSYIGSSQGVPSIYLGTGNNKTILHTGNYSDYALPLSGGAISGQFGSLEVKRSDAPYASGIKFSNTSGTLGYIGIDDDAVAKVWDANQTVVNTIIHSGNYSSLLAGGTINGSITATSFIGNLTGTADNATRFNDLDTSDFARHYATYSGNPNNMSEGFVGGKLYSAEGWVNNYAPFLSVGHDIYKMQFNGWGNALYYRAGDDSGTENKEWKTIAFVDSNVASATKLATPRTIWGQSFDGTENISGELTNVTTIKGETSKGVYLHNPYNNYPTNSGDLSKAVMIGTAPSVYGLGIWGKSTGHVHAQVGRCDGTNTPYNLFLQEFGGNVAIGGTTADSKLHVHGDVKASSSITTSDKMYGLDFCTTSDNRLKDFTKDVIVDFNELKNIPKKYYYWKDKSMGEELQIGTSAQELAKVYPECVSYNEKEDRYSVNYQKLSIIALAAIDKLHERISVLEKKLNDQNS